MKQDSELSQLRGAYFRLKLLKSLTNSEIQQIQKAFLDHQHIYSGGTLRVYVGAFLKFDSYCDLFGYRLMPANKAHVIEYILSLIGKGYGTSAVIQAASSIRFFHEIMEMECPVSSRRVKTAIKYARTPRQAKRLATPIMPQESTAHFGGIAVEPVFNYPGNSLFDLRTIAMVSIGVDTGMKGRDLVNVRIGDLFLSSKNSRLRHRATDATLTDSCVWFELNPQTINSLQKWLSVSNLDLRSGFGDTPVFPSISKRGHVGDNPISTLTLNRQLQSLFSKVQLADSREMVITAQSLRAGRVLHLLYQGLSVTEVQKAMNMRCVLSVMRYVEDYPREQ